MPGLRKRPVELKEAEGVVAKKARVQVRGAPLDEETLRAMVDV